MKYSIKEIKPRIFLLDFKNKFDCNMLFLRYQEFYESPKFKGKAFSIIEFMRWYTKAKNINSFTYVDDWSGFNIPGEVIKKCLNSGFIDHNFYDTEMSNIYNQILSKYSDGKFYLIGCFNSDTFTIKHEIAHGFYYLIPEYKKEAKKLVRSLNKDVKQSIYFYLKSIGYCKSVYIDECQAYLSAGTNYFETVDNEQEFVDLFNSYYEVE